jgi:type VI secretion system protein VasG
MMRGMASTMEKHHRVQVLDEALEAAVQTVASLYSGPPTAGQGGQPAGYRQRPGGDQPARGAGGGRRLSPPHRRARRPNWKSSVAKRRWGSTPLSASRATEKLQAEQGRGWPLEARWQEEKGLVDQILDCAPNCAASGRQGRELATASQLTAEPDPAAANPWTSGTRVLAGRVAADSAQRGCAGGGLGGRRLDRHSGRAHGQERDRDRPEAGRHHQPARHRPAPRAGDDRPTHPDLARRLDNPNKPIGVFMLAGPSGVGKTETALGARRSLYGGEQNLITINMSEFQEAHTVSRLKGARPATSATARAAC